jgi:Sec7-like guanine-nucleotide exchange factor
LCCLPAQFKSYLKSEIGVFLEGIYLKMLSTENSTYAHKVMALTMFKCLCEDPQTIVDIFVNYDCDLEEANIFQLAVAQLETFARGGFSGAAWMSAQEAASLRMVALESLVALLRSLVVWTLRMDLTRQNVLDSAVDSTASAAADDDDDDDLLVVGAASDACASLRPTVRPCSLCLC